MSKVHSINNSKSECKSCFKSLLLIGWNYDKFTEEYVPYKLNSKPLTTSLGKWLTRLGLLALIVYAIYAFIQFVIHANLNLNTTRKIRTDDWSSKFGTRISSEITFEVGLNIISSTGIPIRTSQSSYKCSATAESALTIAGENPANWICPCSVSLH